VTNPLCGINGASSVYGPQKGVRHEQVAEFDRGLLNFSQVSADFVGFNAANLAGAGAAGGLGYAFLQFLNTKLVSGVEYLLNALQIDSVIQAADLVFTGEGQSDAQTAQGKVALGVAIRAKLYNKPVLLISGALRPEAYQLHQHGIDFITSIQDYPAQLEQVMQAEVAAKLLGQRIEESLRLLLIGRSLSNKVS
jgi:glycerate kinase